MTNEGAYLAAMASNAPITADELLRMSIPNKHVELVRGALVVREPAGGRHGWVTVRLTAPLAAFVQANDLGHVYAAETGFKLATQPDTVLAPDIAFISRERFPDPVPLGYPPLAPDLVVEVVSPSDRPGEVVTKVADWLNAGTRLVWVLDPEERRAVAYRPAGIPTRLTVDDVLNGEDVVPGFSVPLADIL